MDFETAKLIPIREIMTAMNATLVKERDDSLMYLSPIRNENTASFHVTPSLNAWFDHGIDEGGGIIQLVCRRLKYTGEDSTEHDALRWLRNMTGQQRVIIPFKPTNKPRQPGWRVKFAKPLRHIALMRYAEGRGLDGALAGRFFSEVLVQHQKSGKSMLALGFLNESNGYELRNPYLKSCVSPKDITFVRGKVAKPKAIHLFEGSFDMVSAFARCPEKLEDHDAISLNSLSCVDKAFAYIRNYGYQTVYTWLDNDDAGRDANMKIAQFVRSQPGLQHQAMNWLYCSHKDVNQWHVAQLMR